MKNDFGGFLKIKSCTYAIESENENEINLKPAEGDFVIKCKLKIQLMGLYKYK